MTVSHRLVKQLMDRLPVGGRGLETNIVDIVPANSSLHLG